MIKQIASIILTVLLCWALHNIQISRLEKKYRQALITQAVTLKAECDKEKQLTMEVSNDLQDKLADLRDQLDNAKRVQPNRCVPVAAGSSRRPDVFTQNAQLSDANGVYSDDLLDFAAECEQTGRQLDGLQGFVKKVWQTRNN